MTGQAPEPQHNRVTSLKNLQSSFRLNRDAEITITGKQPDEK
jgi:hypothetical protein